MRLLRIIGGLVGDGSPALSGEFELTRVTRLRVSARRRATLRCTNGKAWVTFEFDPHDYFLLRGQTVTIAAGRRAFVEGIPDCSLSIRFARAPGAASEASLTGNSGLRPHGPGSSP